MAIECENCQGTDFEIQNGATFCVICGTESQEHGQETVVDEETLGAFGEHATGLKSKALGKKGTKGAKGGARKEKYKVSYSSLMVYTYILKGWVQDAINELKVDERLNQVTLALWAQYLSKTRIAFTKNPNISKKPCFRDWQVKILNRRRVLDPTKLWYFDKRKERIERKEKEREEIDYFSDDTTESRRKRRRAQRQFVDSIASTMSDDESMSTSYLSSASFSESDDESSEIMDENHPEMEEAHMHVLSNVSSKKNCFGHETFGVEVPRLKVIFALFSIGVLLLENKKLNLADLVRFAKNGTISYETSPQHVPPVLKIRTTFDLQKFSGIDDHRYPLDHMTQRKLMNRLGSLLNLRLTDFGDLDPMVRRYLREFCLPKSLGNILKGVFGASKLYKLSHRFEPFQKAQTKRAERNSTPLDSSDLRAVAFILFALKYLYGLDDYSEYYPRIEDSFNPLEWMRLSRERAFLACKYSSSLHWQLKSLFPEVQMSPAAWYNFVRRSQLKLSEMFNAKANSYPRYYTKEEEMAKELASGLYTKPLQAKFKEAKLEKFDCRGLRSPLYAFSKHYMTTKDPEEETFDITALKDLDEMRNQKIKMKTSNEKAETIEVLPPFYSLKVPHKWSQNVVFQEEQKPLRPEEDKTYNFRPLYWRTTLTNYQKTLDNFVQHSEQASCHLLSILPENFGWILNYFSCSMDVKPTELYHELLKVEDFILENDAHFFGNKILSSKVGTYYHGMKDFQYKLSLS